MSGVQRYYVQNPPGQPTEFVSYADHVVALAAERAKNVPWTCAKDGSLNPYGFVCLTCAVAEAEQRRDAEWLSKSPLAVAYAAAMTAARDAVDALVCPACGYGVGDEALAAIDALRGAEPVDPVKAERERIIQAIKDYYRVAPKAAEPLLSKINEG